MSVTTTTRARAEKVGRYLQRLDPDRIGRLIVWSGTAAFASLFSALSISRFERFRTFTFDFGIFDQGLWLLSQAKEPFVSLRGLNLFADHSSYIMVLLTPLYWIWADARLLLVLTVVALAVSAPLLYSIARTAGVKPGLATVLALGLLAHPATTWATWDNFHPELLTLPLILGAVLLVMKERPWWGVALATVALTAKEDVGLIIVPLGLWLAWRFQPRAAGLTMAAIGVAAFALNFLVLLPNISPTGEVLYAGRYADYGEGAFGILSGVVTQPGSLIGDLLSLSHLGYLAAMLFALPVSLLSPAILLIAGPITAANMLSTHTYQVDIRYHYTVYLLAVTAIAAVFGALWLQKRVNRNGYLALIGVMLVAGFVSFSFSPERADWGTEPPDPDVQSALALIGPDDGVAAETTLATQLAHREHIYRFPNPFTSLDYSAPGLPYQPPVSEVIWVILKGSKTEHITYGEETLATLMESGEWKVVVENDSAFLLGRIGRE